MARPAKGTRPIVVDGKTYRWKVVPPIVSDCPMCASWHVVVITEPEHELAAEIEVDVDPETERPLAVTPALVGEYLRSFGARQTRWPTPTPTHTHQRRATRQRHRSSR